MVSENNVEIPKHLASISASDFKKLIEKILIEVDFKLLKDTLENNVCHDNESIYDHTLEIVKKLTESLSLDYLHKQGAKHLAQTYFKQRIGKYSRAELFILSAFLHDLGKKETIQINEDGTTSCPGHEKVSANISKEALHKLKFKKEDVEYIYNVVKLHGGYSLRFLDYLQTLTELQLDIALGSCYLLPEKLLFQVADNEAAESFSEYKKLINDVLLQKEIIYQVPESNLSKIDLSQLFSAISTKIKTESKPWPEEARMFHLSEEVGELHDIYMQYKGAKDREQTIEHIKGALNDVVFELVALYDLYGLDIGQVLKDEIEKDE